MATAKRPTAYLSGKTNVIPSIDRMTEATAEDFKEIADILSDHAMLIDQVNRTDEASQFYGFFTSLDLVAAQYPNAPEDSFAVIDPGNGNPQQIAKVVNGTWTLEILDAPIQFYATKADRPATGQEGIWYIVKDEKIAYLWYDGKYNGFGKDGANGMNAYEVAVAFGFVGTEQEWLASLVGPEGPQGPPGPSGDGSVTPNQVTQFIAGHKSGLTFQPYAQFYIDGVLGEDFREVTSDAADPTLPRYDVFAIEKATQQIVIIKGTAADPRTYPEVDPLTHLDTGVFIDIPAGATAPAGITKNTIYSEGAEWTITADPAKFDTQNTANPKSGTKAIKTLQALTSQSNIAFEPASPLPLTEGMEIHYNIANIAGGDHTWVVQGHDKNGRMISMGIGQPSNYDPAATTYQFLATVAISTHQLVDIRKILFVAIDPNMEFYLDEITISGGSGTTSPDVTKEFVLAEDQKLQNQIDDHETRIVALEGAGSSYAPSSDYADVPAMLVDQANQVENEEYTVTNASGWSAITHSGWATFKKKATSTASEDDYDLREQQDFDSEFSATANQYGTHPAFASQNEAIIWLLQNGGGTANPELFQQVQYDTQDPDFRSFYEASGFVTPSATFYNGATYVVGMLKSANNYAPVIIKYAADGTITYNGNIGTIDNNDPMAHNNPTVMVKDGFIYIAEVNGHGADIKIWKSNAIEDISAFTLHHTIVGPFGYLNMRNLPDGRVVMYSRATNVGSYPSFTGEAYSALYAVSGVDDLTTWTLLNGTQRGPIEVRHYTAPFYHYGVNEYTYAGINLRHSSPDAVFFGQAMWKTKDQIAYSDLPETTSKNLTTSLFSSSEVENSLTIVGSNADTRTYRGGLGGVVVNDTVYCSYFDAENTVWKFRKIFRDGTIRDYPCNLTELPTTGLDTNKIDYIRLFYNGKNLVVVTNDANFIKVHACDLNFGNLQYLKTIYNKTTTEGVGGAIIPWNLDQVTGDYIIAGDGTGDDTLMRYFRSNTVFEITVPEYTDFEIIRPTAAEVYDQGKDIVIALNLNGSDQNITKVEYLYGTTLIASVTTAPFDSYRWSNPPVGADTLTVKIYKSGTLFQTKTVDYEVQAGLTTADAISYWRFEETASPFTDSIGTNDATQTSGTNSSTTNGKLGRGLVFVGANELVEVPHNDNLSFTDGLGNGVNSDIPFSIETWVKFSNVGVTGTIIEKMIAGAASEYRLIHLGGSNTILFGLYDTTDTNRLKLTAPFNAVQDQWYHIVVTYDGSGTVAGLNFIIDGVAPIMTKTVDGTYTGTKRTAATLCFGNSSNLSLDLSGTIDESVFWNKELTLQEAQDRYNNGNGAILNV